MNQIELSLCDRNHYSFGDFEISKLKTFFFPPTRSHSSKTSGCKLLNMLRIRSGEIKEPLPGLPTLGRSM